MMGLINSVLSPGGGGGGGVKVHAEQVEQARDISYIPLPGHAVQVTAEQSAIGRFVLPVLTACYFRTRARVHRVLLVPAGCA